MINQALVLAIQTRLLFAALRTLHTVVVAVKERVYRYYLTIFSHFYVWPQHVSFALCLYSNFLLLLLRLSTLSYFFNRGEGSIVSYILVR